MSAQPSQNPQIGLHRLQKGHWLTDTHTLSTGLASDGFPLRANMKAPMSLLSASLNTSLAWRVTPYPNEPHIRSYACMVCATDSSKTWPHDLLSKKFLRGLEVLGWPSLVYVAYFLGFEFTQRAPNSVGVCKYRLARHGVWLLVCIERSRS